MAQQTMTRGEFMEILSASAEKYCDRASSTIIQNKHMNKLSSRDIVWIKKNAKKFGRITDAILVDFLNYIARKKFGMDYGMYTHHLREKEIPRDI